MCETCGCGKPDDFSLRIPEDGTKQEHRHDHDHHHDDGHDHHDHEHEHEHKHAHHHHEEKKHISVNKDILSENNMIAERNRGYFEGRRVFCLNLVSSPGSGKTTLLEKTIRDLGQLHGISVIEGDQQSMNDAERIKKTGVPVIQINTGTGCHLDANMVMSAISKLEIGQNSILFIENVGNLVCPALFDLGEKKRVVVISVTEGDDKPEKYPYMFASAQLCIINKTDLLPYVDFNAETLISSARRVNPKLEFLMVSARTGVGIQEWYDWILQNRTA